MKPESIKQINLYDAKLRRSYDLFSARVVVPFVAGVFAISMAFAILAKREESRVKETLAAAQSSLDQKKSSVSALQGLNKASDDVIRSLEEKVTARENLIRAALGLTQSTVTKPIKHSSVLEAFSRQVREGIWITALKVAGHGHEILVEGRTANPASMADYLNNVSRDEVFADMSISGFKISEDERTRNTPTPLFKFEFRIHGVQEKGGAQ